MFKRILVANRGEIALRVIRACRELGVATVAVYSDADRHAMHVAAADEAVYLGPTPPAQSYLHAERIFAAAHRAGCDAIHPGYGFLAENAAFASACAREGLTFVGPSASAMRRMGDKLAARATAQEAGVPVVPGSAEAVATAAAARELAQSLGYPVAVKASAGGGGKGLKIATSAAQLDQAAALASKEAEAYFGNATIYVEKYLAAPKHVEVQVLGDKHGAAVQVGERDCSLQRRHQKLVEETPACVSPSLRSRMHDAALTLARAIGYDNAGTIECLVEGENFYFLEMNTRIQVEHTITEATYGIDLVKAQIRIAAGEPLWLSQADLAPRGHAIECRINAEDPSAGFAPSPGRIARYIEPGGPGIRVDSAAFAGWVIPTDYDSLVAKLIAWGTDREESRMRMLRALAEYSIEGIQTTIGFYQKVLSDPSFTSGEYTTSSIDRFVGRPKDEIGTPRDRSANEAAADGREPSTLTVEVNDKQYRVRVFDPGGASKRALRPARKYRRATPLAASGRAILAPMHGIVAEIRVKEGDELAAGQVAAVVEAMKMMNEVVAPRAGKVAAVNARAGQTIEAGSPLIFLEEANV